MLQLKFTTTGGQAIGRNTPNILAKRKLLLTVATHGLIFIQAWVRSAIYVFFFAVYFHFRLLFCPLISQRNDTLIHQTMLSHVANLAGNFRKWKKKRKKWISSAGSFKLKMGTRRVENVSLLWLNNRNDKTYNSMESLYLADTSRGSTFAVKRIAYAIEAVTWFVRKIACQRQAAEVMRAYVRALDEAANINGTRGCRAATENAFGHHQFNRLCAFGSMNVSCVMNSPHSWFIEIESIFVCDSWSVNKWPESNSANCQVYFEWHGYTRPIDMPHTHTLLVLTMPAKYDDFPYVELIRMRKHVAAKLFQARTQSEHNSFNHMRTYRTEYCVYPTGLGSRTVVTHWW